MITNATLRVGSLVITSRDAERHPCDATVMESWHRRMRPTRCSAPALVIVRHVNDSACERLVSARCDAHVRTLRHPDVQNVARVARRRFAASVTR